MNKKNQWPDKLQCMAMILIGPHYAIIAQSIKENINICEIVHHTITATYLFWQALVNSSKVESLKSLKELLAVLPNVVKYGNYFRIILFNPLMLITQIIMENLNWRNKCNLLASKEILVGVFKTHKTIPAHPNCTLLRGSREL